MKETEEGRYLYTSMDALEEVLDAPDKIKSFFDDNAVPNPSDSDGIPESVKIDFDGKKNIRILRFYEPALEEDRIVIEEYGEMEWPAIGDQPPKKVVQWNEPDAEWVSKISEALS